MSQRTIAAALLILLPLLAYVPALNGGFLWDDDHHVTQNKDLRDAAGLARIWTRLGLASGGTPQYYPLTHTTFWIQYQLWGASPFPYHLVNVLLHAVSAILAWRILLMLNVPGAWVAAAIWAVHPVNVESVAWITERKNVLSGTFCLGAMLLYFKGGWRNYWISLGLFVLALLSKTTVSVMPGVLVAILWWKGRLDRRRMIGLIPFLIVGGILGMITASVERRYVGAVGPDWDLSFVQRILIAGRACWFYLGKLVWPARLSFSYLRWVVDPGLAWQWFFPIAIIAMIGLLWRKPGPRTALLCFLMFLFPAMGFFNIYPMRYSFVADHFQYLASLPMIALGVAALSCLGMKQLGRICAVLILAVLSISTGLRARTFSDPMVLWRDTTAKNPASWMAANNLGMALTRRGESTGSTSDLDEARQLLQTALVLRPNHEWAHYGLGKLDELQGDLGAAKSEFSEEIRVQPNYAPTYFEMGMIAWSESDLPLAREMFEKSRELDSRPPQGRDVPVKRAETRLMLARVYSAIGQSAEAERMLDEAKTIQDQ